MKCGAGHENPGGNDFCGTCGVPLENATPEQAEKLLATSSEHGAPDSPSENPSFVPAQPSPSISSSPPRYVNESPEPAPSKNRKPLAIGAALLVVAIIVVAIVFISQGNGNKEAASPPTTTEEQPSKLPATTSTSTTTTTIPEAQLRADIDAEIQLACSAAKVTGAEPRVDFEADWSGLTTETDMKGAATSCVQQAIEAEVSAAGPVNVDEVIKNPDAVKGQVFRLVAEIMQYDAATGTCAFRASWDNQQRKYSFEYEGDNAFFLSGDGETSCPVLSGIDQSDVVRLWVRGGGTFSYDTQVGGNTTAPSFIVLKAEVIEKK